MTSHDGSPGGPDEDRAGADPTPAGSTSPDRSRHDVSPHDAARLYDLLDGRLAPSVADDVRRRLHDDPAYAALHADLLAVRDALAAMPEVRSSRVEASSPEAFLAAVRRAAGLPPPTEGRAGPNGSASGPNVARGLEPAAPSGTLRVLPTLRRVALPLAACLGLAVGAGLYFAGGVDRGVATSPLASARATDANRGALADDSGSEGFAAMEDLSPPNAAPPAQPGTALGRSDPGAGGAPAGPFRAPGGAVPQGLRPPSDEVPNVPPVSPPAPRAGADASWEADGRPPRATAPRSPHAEGPDLKGDAASEGSLPRDAEARARALRRQLRRASETEGEPAERARAKSKRGAGADRGEAGADDDTGDAVFVLRAASLDEARATVALFLARRPSRDDVARSARPEAQDAVAPPAAPAPAVPPPAPKPSAPAAPSGPSSGAAPAPLGLLLVEVPAGVDLSALPGVSALSGVTEAAAGALPPTASADGVRRVRIVVVPR